MPVRTKWVPLLTALVTLTAALDAQSATRQSFGLLVGGNSSTFANVDVSDDEFLDGATVKRRTGFQAGVFLNRALTSRVSLQPELLYVQRGTSFGVADAGLDGDVTINLAYVELAALLRADLGSANGWRPILTAGPTAAFRTGCDGTTSFGGAKLTVPCGSFDDGAEEDSDIARTDFGASLGAGLAGKLGGASTFIQLRYQRGLVSLFKDIPDGANAPKTSMLSLVVGLSR